MHIRRSAKKSSTRLLLQLDMIEVLYHTKQICQALARVLLAQGNQYKLVQTTTNFLGN